MIRGKGGMGNKFCKVPFQGVCPTNEGYAKGSLDHGKHKDELCTLYTTLMAIASRREVVM